MAGLTEKLAIEPATAQLKLGLGLSLAIRLVEMITRFPKRVGNQHRTDTVQLIIHSTETGLILNF